MTKKARNSVLFFIGISILIHGINIAIVMVAPPKIKMEKVEVEYGVDKPNPDEKGDEAGADKKVEEKSVSEDDVKILPKGDDPSDRVKPTGGYYGIGIIVRNEIVYITYQGQVYPAYVVESTYFGYPADALGLLPGDAIFLVGGKRRDLARNDIKGDGPTPVTLTVERNGRVFVVQTVRAWVDTYE